MKKILVLATLTLCVVFVACNRGANEKGVPHSSLTGTSPDFVLKDIEGKEVALSQFRGKVVLLEFWATWCPPCRATIPELTAIQEKFAGKGLVVLGVSLDEGGDLPAKLSAFSKKLRINYRLLIGNEETERAYNVTSIPMTFLIDREGKVISYYQGYVENLASVVSKQLEKAI